MIVRRNFIASVFGKKGSGKSYLLKRYLDRFPRVLTFDVTGERVEESPGAIEAHTVEQALDALEDVVGRERWHIVCLFDPEDDAARIFTALAPVGLGGYSRSVGGMCVECSEVDLIAPNSMAIHRAVKNAFQRGRHHGLSILAATQRPAAVHRVVTSQSDVVIAFQQHEPRDLKYLADALSQPLSALVPRLPRYWHLRYFPGYGVAEIVDQNGTVQSRYRADGTRLDRGAA